jgi:8-oxo-dGTP pyrophosphatase MutT (NUDIX family)
MSFEPQKFFIGLMDFFSILLPGALLTFLLNNEAVKKPELVGILQQLNGAKGWAAFLVVSYMLGHFAFLLGSWLDEFYDWLRVRTQNTQIQRILKRGKPIRWWIRFLVWLVFKRERNLAVEGAGKIKRKNLSSLQAKETVNNFQWSKALLAVSSPESLAVVQRFEADSKFFRCFVVVLIVMLGLAWYRQRWQLVIAAGVLLPLSLWRYMEQRFKATNQAYWSVITLTAREEKIVIPRVPRESSLTHAGGVVFRKRWLQKPSYLLVEASDDATKWVLPKGKIDLEENARETAVREVHEETGVWARICGELDFTSYYDAKSGEVRLQVYLMEQVGRGFPSDRDRKSKWFSLEAALERATHSETVKLLELAEQRRSRLTRRHHRH